jgi:GMP synthase (glutamine-hydrolysing)
MRRLLVFQHVAHETLGSLDPLLRDAGFRIRYVNYSVRPDAKPSLNRYRGLVVLGGPMNCDQVDRYPHLRREVEAIQQMIDAGKPVLGICLGSQLIARALGARVRKNPVKEIGWYDLETTYEGRNDPVFGRLGKTQKIFQWHGDTFDIPDHAVRLASSPDCRNQAFRYGENVYGLQFHLEVDQPMIERWLLNGGNQREIADRWDMGAKIAEIRHDTNRYVDDSLAIGRELFGTYISGLRQRRRRTALPSR